MAKRNIVTIFLSLAVILGSILMVASPVFAGKCGGTDTTVIDCGDKTGQSAIFEIIKLVIKIMTAGIGILAVGTTIVGGVLYSASGGSPDKIKKAKELWTNTVIGLLLFAFFVAITNFLIPGGVFG